MNAAVGELPDEAVRKQPKQSLVTTHIQRLAIIPGDSGHFFTGNNRKIIAAIMQTDARCAGACI